MKRVKEIHKLYFAQVSVCFTPSMALPLSFHLKENSEKTFKTMENYLKTDITTNNIIVPQLGASAFQVQLHVINSRNTTPKAPWD